MKAPVNSPDSGLLVTYAGNHLCNCVFKPTLNSREEPESEPEHVSPFYRTCEQIAKLQKTLGIKLKENLFEILLILFFERFKVFPITLLYNT